MFPFGRNNLKDGSRKEIKAPQPFNGIDGAFDLGQVLTLSYSDIITNKEAVISTNNLVMEKKVKENEKTLMARGEMC